MTNTTIASAPVVTDKGATVQAIPPNLDAAWLAQAITEFGPLTVSRVVELSGRSETTARKLLKSLVADGTLWKNDEVKPATFELIIDTTEDEAPEAEDEAKIDAIMDAITTEPAKATKSKKVAHTTVPAEHNATVRVNGEAVLVTEAYALLVDPPMFESADEGFAWSNSAHDRDEGDHTAEEIAGLYLATVTDYLEHLYDNGDITRGVWYGRTFRLRRTLVGSGKGTASARPAKMTTEDQ